MRLLPAQAERYSLPLPFTKDVCMPTFIPTTVEHLKPAFDHDGDTMKAAVLHDFNDLRIEEVPRPRPVAVGQVVVRVRACGICATDVKAITGRRRNVTFPLIVGHEPAGVVAAVGPGVTSVARGEEVVCQPLASCGLCPVCRAGNTHYCPHAFTTGGDGPDEVWPGAFAEYLLLPEKCLFHKPPQLSWAAAALTEPLGGAWKGLIQHSQMQVGDDVVILGVGGIGMLCLMVARAAGAGRLVAVDPSAHARAAALELGASQALDPTAGNLRQQLYDLLPAGPDLVLEAAGAIEAVRDMVSLLRRGTRWNVFGITTPETFELEGGLTHFLEARMDASFGTTPRAMQRALRLMEAGLVDPEKIVTHRFPLDELHTAIEIMQTPDHNKILIEP